MEIWMFVILILSSFVAALISGAAGFGGALLLLPVATACVGAEIGSRKKFHGYKTRK